jgi:phosphoribosylpyrophosphate synthetase
MSFALDTNSANKVEFCITHTTITIPAGFGRALRANAIDKIIFSDANESSTVIDCVGWGKLTISTHQIVSGLANAGSAVPDSIARALGANFVEEVVA